MRHDLGEADYSKAYSCVKCSLFSSAIVNDVRRHIRSDCTVSQFDDDVNCILYYCVYCDRDFERTSRWTQHMKDDHSDEFNRLFKAQGLFLIACGLGPNPHFDNRSRKVTDVLDKQEDFVSGKEERCQFS